MQLTDEEARLGQQLVQATREFGGYLADVLGDLPKDLVGLLAGDRIKVTRARRLAEGWDKTKQLLKNRQVEAPEPPSMKLALPMLSALADETNDELREIWPLMRLSAIAGTDHWPAATKRWAAAAAL